MWSRLALAVVVTTAACSGARTPEVRVLGVRPAAASQVLVQVTNPASRPMRLTKLEFVFASAASGHAVSSGEMPLWREIPAGAAAVVEVPLDADASEPLTLRGEVTAELDQIVRTFPVSAEIQPH